jgi:archaellum component FlaF (FlaF/FlaG flagellin family)
MDRNLKTPAFRPLPEGRGLLGGYFKFAKKNCGDAMIVATVLLFPLLAVLIYGGVMYSQMADVSNIVEEAARAGARYYAAHDGDEITAIEKAQEVVEGSANITPVKDIRQNGEGRTFNKETDIVVGKEGNYAYCIVTYHYPTPVKGLLRLIGGDDLAESMGVKGKAYFKSNEGDL